MAYQILCDSHGYGPARMVYDEVIADKHGHVEEYPDCASSVEIHESTSGGGYEVLEGSDGSQLPDRTDDDYASQ
jgi:hypothetical protein